MITEPSEPPLTLADLPPLPTPDGETRTKEERRGVLLVFLAVSLCVGLTHGLSLSLADELSGIAWWLIFGLVYGEALAALGSLVWLLRADPGVVQRTESNCFPLPAVCESRIRKGDTVLLDLQNVVDGSDSFCTRCLVWRRAGHGAYHHCRVCQRCVRNFDHHCGIFGRCIAGSRCETHYSPTISPPTTRSLASNSFPTSSTLFLVWVHFFLIPSPLTNNPPHRPCFLSGYENQSPRL